MSVSRSLLSSLSPALVLCLAAVGAQASEFRMGNVDRSGSRSIAEGGEGLFTRENVDAHGLRVKWTAQTSASVAGPAATFANAVYVGDLAGYLYAFDQSDGSLLWRTCVEAQCPGPFFFSGVLGSPLIRGNTVYVGTLSGSLVALDAMSGAVRWVHTPMVTPPVYGLPLDSVWGGPISVRDMVIYALAPNDEFGLGVYGRSAVLAVDATTGAEVWRRPLIDDAAYAAGSAGAGVWNITPTYSPELDMIFVGTGQDTNPAGGDAGSDSFFAIDARDGSIVWQTQVRTGDTWSTVLPFDPLNPTDTDIGDSPAVFKHNGRVMIAAGDKRGIFWVLDAMTGEILNGGGAGLDLFYGILPGPGLTGGFNLDGGYVNDGNEIRHFSVFSDQTTMMQHIVDTFPGGVCVNCPNLPDTGNLIVLLGDGSGELCRYSAPSTQIFTPIHVDGMVVVRGAEDGTVHVVDIDDCAGVTTLAVPTGPYGGASLSFAEGVIYTGGGVFGAPGLTAIEAAVP